MATPHDTPDAPEALEALRRELVRLGQPARVRTDMERPRLAAYEPGGLLTVEHVFVALHDEPAYYWRHVSRSHPLDDPAGAARRITAGIAREWGQPSPAPESTGQERRDRTIGIILALAGFGYLEEGETATKDNGYYAMRTGGGVFIGGGRHGSNAHPGCCAPHDRGDDPVPDDGAEDNPSHGS